MDVLAFIWLVILILCLVVEGITTGLAAIWFAGGALVSFVLALLGVPLLAQAIVFLAVSLLLLIFVRKAALRWTKRSTTKTNAESLIGETGVVTERIDNLAAKGQVQVHGQYWTARSCDDGITIEKDQKVKIFEISGVKLIVKEV